MHSFGCPICCTSDPTLKYFGASHAPPSQHINPWSWETTTFFLAPANGTLPASGREFQWSPVPREERSIPSAGSEPPMDSELHPAHPLLPPQHAQKHLQLPSVCPQLQLTDVSLHNVDAQSQRKVNAYSQPSALFLAPGSRWPLTCSPSGSVQGWGTAAAPAAWPRSQPMSCAQRLCRTLCCLW